MTITWSELREMDEALAIGIAERVLASKGQSDTKAMAIMKALMGRR